MNRFLLYACSLLCALSATAADNATLIGTFLVNVDDHATIFVNGAKVFHADLGTSRSKQIKLSVGDRIAIHLTNDMGPKHFILVFESSDNASIVSFRASDYHVAMDAGLRDFQADEYAKWTKEVNPKWTKEVKKLPGHKGLEHQVKNYSEWVWGDLDRCALACILTPKQITARPN